MGKVVIVPATVEHAAILGPRLRREDAQECLGLYGWTGEQALRESLEWSASAFTALVDGEPIAMFGVWPVQILGAVACPWLLTGPGVERYRFTLMREAKSFIRQTRMVWPVLLNLVDSRYGRALCFVRRLGFSVKPPEPLGSVMACRIEMGA